jgi:hypothetical protein
MVVMVFVVVFALTVLIVRVRVDHHLTVLTIYLALQTG